MGQGDFTLAQTHLFLVKTFFFQDLMLTMSLLNVHQLFSPQVPEGQAVDSFSVYSELSLSSDLLSGHGNSTLRSLFQLQNSGKRNWQCWYTLCIGFVLLMAECFNKFISPTCLANMLKTGTVVPMAPKKIRQALLAWIFPSCSKLEFKVVTELKGRLSTSN